MLRWLHEGAAFTGPERRHGWVVVLGAGPAGAAVALGLKRLGYPVRVVSEWRRFAALEGVSQRVLEACVMPVSPVRACADAPSARRVAWGADSQSINRECLLDRPRFDAALREDLAAVGIAVQEARVLRVEALERGTSCISTAASRCVRISWWKPEVARHRWRGRLRGPETLSLLNTWREAPGQPGSALESLADGWAWMARREDGRCYWQITLDARDLPPKEQLPAWCAQRSESALVRELFGEVALQPADLHARSSTAILFNGPAAWTGCAWAMPPWQWTRFRAMASSSPCPPRCRRRR